MIVNFARRGTGFVAFFVRIWYSIVRRAICFSVGFFYFLKEIGSFDFWNLLPEGGYGATPEYIEYGALCKLPSDKATLEA